MISTGVHAGIIVLLMIFSVVSCRSRKPRNELQMFVNIAETPPPPAPAPPEPVAPAPKPPPPQPKPQPKPPAPKPKPVPPKPRPEPPRLREQDIKKLLSEAVDIPKNPQQPPLGFDWYYAIIRAVMYDAWAQPSSVSRSAGLTAVVSIRVMRDGSITRRSMVRSSGNSVMDRSVMDAVESVKQLQALPAGMTGAYQDIIINFELAE